jgi:hypothetical protein
MLGRLQVMPPEHPRQVGPADLKDRLEMSVERFLYHGACVQLRMLTPPSGDGIVGDGLIVLCQPGSGPIIVSIPGEFVHKKRPARAEEVGERPNRSVKFGMVQRHDGGNCIKLAQPLRVFNTLPHQTRMRRCGGIHSECVEAKLSQAVNESAVTTSDIEDACACRDYRPKNCIEVLPPPRIGHTPKRTNLPPASAAGLSPILPGWSVLGYTA